MNLIHVTLENNMTMLFDPEEHIATATQVNKHRDRARGIRHGTAYRLLEPDVYFLDFTSPFVRSETGCRMTIKIRSRIKIVKTITFVPTTRKETSDADQANV